MAWIVSRWRILVASALAVALVLSLGVWFIQSDLASRNEAVDCSQLEADDFDLADTLATACDSDVEVLSARTPWQTSWATPRSDVRMELSAVPVRVQDEGSWKSLDTSLAADAEDGTLSAVAPVYPIELNAGGLAGRNDPLGSITRDGKRFDVWFPLSLPVPTVTDSQAIYDLAVGIKLFVSINIDGTGFLPVVELEDAAAADRFTGLLEAERIVSGGEAEGSDLEFETVASEGLTLTKDDDNAIHVVDGDGETHFLATSPLMWDSAGQTIPADTKATEVGPTDRTRTPADGDAIAAMGVDISGETIVISPDDSMLEDSETVWPVYIDPSFSGKGASSWEAVRSGGYTGTLHQWGDISASSPGQGSGYCSAAASCIKVFKQRLAWRFTGLSNVSVLAGADISSAQFRVNGVHSASCTAARTDFVRTSPISTASTWSNLTYSSTISGYRTEAHSVSCANRGFKEFNALQAVRYAADNNQTYINVGLKANNETTMTGWKRFRHDATLQFVYNRTPAVPSLLTLTDPVEPACTTGASRPAIATTTPTLSAIASDPDGLNVMAAFEVSAVATPTVVTWSSGNLAAAASGSRRTAAVPTAKLVDGGIYQWRARANDGALTSAWSPYCEFKVDTTRPLGPAVTALSAGTGIQAVYRENRISGGAHQAGSFSIDRGATGTDVTAFVYGFNNAGSTQTVTPDINGIATVSYTPAAAGPVTLSVKSRDAGGNLSLATNYTFTVATPTEDATWTLDEGQGATSAGSVGENPSSLTISGAQWGDGPHALFNSRQGDHALALDGVNDFASADLPVVDTEESFVVSAHVRLNAANIGQNSYTALAQDGAQTSGFRLEYDSTCIGMPSGCWAFAMSDTAAGGAEHSVQSAVTVKGDEWVHLVGERNATANTLQIWVCEIGTPENPAVGNPVVTSGADPTESWPASGAFTVGRGLTAGEMTGFWPGAIDNVRVFSGEVVSVEKIRRLCQGAEATDFDGRQAELDPTTEVE
ncbi:LamG domain-containing protein [Glaciihabitans arcticus]|uniref:LamG domain-containing protein n=1 Tax=Glaciihabitans arcticus TaxID=2668039 RepID=A0A4Q9GQU9_9MICO|nr:LamG-like jellyroll fold domain-containing protein [Glaciihabitans arcticus]TBN57252.1 LamG domain-containing protein [Glaciihabitans arcticus]